MLVFFFRAFLVQICGIFVFLIPRYVHGPALCLLP